MIFIIVSILLVILFIKFRKKYRGYTLGTENFVTGEVKSGKTAFCIGVGLKEIKKRRLKAFIYNLFHREKQDLPVLYTNIPILYKHCCKVTKELLERKERFIYGSVVILDELSLLADSMNYSNAELNEKLTLFFKLFGHETKGGLLLENSQDLKDVHYAIKRSTNGIYYINQRINLPFYVLIKFKRFLSVVDDNVQIDDTEYTFFLPKRVFKLYDSCCYSKLTDNLPVSAIPYELDTLKVDDIVSFRKFRTIQTNKRSEVNK